MRIVLLIAGGVSSRCHQEGRKMGVGQLSRDFTEPRARQEEEFGLVSQQPMQ